MSIESRYDEYMGILQRAADLNNAAAVLGWDQEVYMPPAGAQHRARQLATLAEQAHELLTSEQLGQLLQQLSGGELSENQAANVRRSREDYEKNKKIPAAFVTALSLQTSECFNAWVDARRKNDYTVYAPSLAKMIALKREQADLLGYQKHPYNALLDEYEPGATVAMLDGVFDGLKRELPAILARIKAAEQVPDDCFHQHFPRQQQWDFSMDVLKAIGFDFNAGRQDYAEHPFTTSFSPGDVRLTTRVDEQNFASLLWSSIHEGGHGLYEQGLPLAEYGMPLGSAASLGIHESQSRLWENCVGRGIDFWTYFYPRLQAVFPTQLGNVSLLDFYKAANRVSPSLIRTEADEVTYHFHVLIRYELEKALFDGSLQPDGLAAAWNDKYQQYLGIRPPDDCSGILQDVHWSHGSFGYFPTYTLGSFYAAQFFAAAQTVIPGLDAQMRQGEFNQLLTWLRQHVHVHGRQYSSEELCTLITGKPLDVSYFLKYISEKYSVIYP